MMQTQSHDTLTAAKLLDEQHDKNIPFASLPSHLAPKTESEAYAIQSQLFDLRKSRLGSIAGYKVALTSEVMQKLLRFPSPFSGPLHGKLIYSDGATLDANDYGRICIECEIAAVLKSDITPKERPYDATDIAEAIDTIAPALEIVDDRNANYDHISGEVLTLIADNAWNAGLVQGRLVKNWRELDLASLKGAVHINEQLIDTGYGRDVLGHPFNALSWLANKILEQNQIIEAGMTVMTGTMITTQFVKSGDHLSFSIPELGSVSIDIA
jgi:2-keto-4-pentenoate hydratase